MSSLLKDFVPFDDDSEDDSIRRGKLSPAILTQARLLHDSGMPLSGPDGVGAFLRRSGIDVSDGQLRTIKHRGWEYKGRRREGYKFSEYDVAAIMEIALHSPCISREELGIAFRNKTGRNISSSYAWSVANAALLRLPARKSPILTAGHLALREAYHVNLLRVRDQIPNILWTDETYVAYHPAQVKQRAFCTHTEDPRRNQQAPRDPRRIMFHGCVSLRGGGLPIFAFPEGQMMTDSVYLDLLHAEFQTPHPVATSIFQYLLLDEIIIWMQDNAPAHTSANIMNVLQKFRRLSFWPPNSPDFNPIEFVWGAVKKAIELKKWDSRQEMVAAVRTEWAHQTHPTVFWGHTLRALENLERSAAVGYATVHH